MKAQLVDLETVSGPTFPAVNQRIIQELDARPRGARTALATALGMAAATVSHWTSMHQSPEPERWPAIEEHFDLPEGTLRGLAGLGTEHIDARFTAIEDRLAAIELALAQLRLA